MLILEHLAGGAAETELADGDGTFSRTDYEHAREVALELVDEPSLSICLDRHFMEARKLVSGPLRAPVLAVAERLRTKRTIEGAALRDLWAEVNPSPSPGAMMSSPWLESGMPFWGLLKQKS